jgi:hypothetical protein
VLALLEQHGAARKAAITAEIASLKKKRPAAKAEAAQPPSSSEPESDTPRSVPSSPRKSALRQPNTPQTPRRAVKFRPDDAPPSDVRTPTKPPRFPSTTTDDEEDTPRRSVGRPAAPEEAPATPRGKRGGSRSPSKSPTKPGRRAKSPSPVPSDEDDYVAPPRRYRPVFADRQQWLAPDPRAAREWAAARRAATQAEAMWGHPFRHAMDVDPAPS